MLTDLVLFLQKQYKVLLTLELCFLQEFYLECLSEWHSNCVERYMAF